MISVSAFSQVSNQVGVTAGLGARTLWMTDAQVDRGMGVEGSLAFDYRLAANHFLMKTGVGAAVGSTAFHMLDTDVKLPNSIDQDGYDFTFVYQFSNHAYRHTQVEMQVPLMFGATFNGIYFLLGGTFNLSPISWGKSSAKLSTYGDYPQFLDPFTGMPEHQFFDEKTKDSKGTMRTLVWYPSASLEIGYTLPVAPAKRGEHLLRFALYADYALLNIFKGTASAPQINLIETPETFNWDDMYTPVQLRPLFSTPLTSGIAKGQLSIGVKFSYALSVPAKKPQKSGPCRCMQFN